MLIGIMSDSHDDMAQIKKAVELFNTKGVSHVLHAGDIVSPFTFELLGSLGAPFTGIFGNNDGDRVLLTEKSSGRISVQPLMIELGGRRFAMVHEPASSDSLARSGSFDVVIYGHTHRPEIRQLSGALIINPGKTARLHKGTSTVALLDVKSMQAELIELP